MKKKVFFIALTACALLLCLYFLYRSYYLTLPFVFKSDPMNWSVGYAITHSPWEIDENNICKINKNDLGVHPVPQLMADPFVVKDDGSLYIFYEEFLGRKCSRDATIAVLSSVDNGETWKREGVALDEPFHLSFPNVFKYKNNWYLIPEAGNSMTLRLYIATAFPLKWELKKIFFEGERITDPAVWVDETNDIVYILFLGKGLELWYSTDGMTTFHKHPLSPIRTKINLRPAGTIKELGGNLYYFIQQAENGNYGTGVYAYQVDTISQTEFKDHILQETPILYMNGTDWMEKGMHQLDFISLSDSTYFVVVDGIGVQNQKLKWDWQVMPTLNRNKN